MAVLDNSVQPLAQFGEGEVGSLSDDRPDQFGMRFDPVAALIAVLPLRGNGTRSPDLIALAHRARQTHAEHLGRLTQRQILVDGIHNRLGQILGKSQGHVRWPHRPADNINEIAGDSPVTLRFNP